MESARTRGRAALLALGLAGCMARPAPPLVVDTPQDPPAPAPTVTRCDGQFCLDGRLCDGGTCRACAKDSECVFGYCDLTTGRCARGEQTHAFLPDLTDVQRAWVQERIEIAFMGNVAPDAYEACHPSRHCQLRWDMNPRLFSTNSAEVTADPAVVLMLAAGFADDETARLTVVGHASELEQDPEGLALRRATEVRAWLVGEGLDGSRIEVRSEGIARPVYRASVDPTRRADQRVELLLSSDANPVGWWPRPRRPSVEHEP